MKNKILISLITILIVSGGVALFSAFEAHVINVTAHIENALKVIPPAELIFGTVFPQEYLEKPFLITASDSFCEQDRVSTINYKIVQKPKPIWPEPKECGQQFANEDAARVYCHQNSSNLNCCYPLLCPYLSKTIIDADPKPYDDYGVPAFHDISAIATGTIDKDNDMEDFWLVDLDVPCFAGMCAQDWTHHGWELDPALESETFGCDLWIEVTGISSGVSEKELACIASGGTVTTSMCCLATGDFPDTCSIGACGCAPQDSHEVKACSCPAGYCFDGNSCVSNHLVISEVYYDALGTEPDEEWIEVYNPTQSIVDLTNYKLGDEEAQSEGEGMFQFPSGAQISSNGFVVVAYSATAFYNLYGFNPDFEISDSDAGVPNMTKYSAWATGDIRLANIGEEVLLLDGFDSPVDVVVYGTGVYPGVIAHSGVIAGHSIARSPVHKDTNDCSVDFVDLSLPTPGS